MSSASNTEEEREAQPIAKAFGLLLGSVVVGIGLWSGLQPETILLRAALIGVSGGLVVRIGIAGWQILQNQEDE